MVGIGGFGRTVIYGSHKFDWRESAEKNEDVLKRRRCQRGKILREMIHNMGLPLSRSLETSRH